MDSSYKRKNNYYKTETSGSKNWNKKKFRNYLQPGMKGFLCSCNSREKDCVRESYNLLNEYADKLYGPDDIIRHLGKEENETTEDAATRDIEDELVKEVSSLKAKPWTPGRFGSADTGIRGKIFIKTSIEDPVKLAHTILSDVAETKIQKARFLLRIVPVEVTCKAYLEEIKKAADTLFDKHFRCEPTTFAIVISKKYNESLLRDELIHSLALLVTDKNSEHKANLKEAKHTVLVDIMKGVCCMSVLEDYKKLRHYNLAELTKPESEETENSGTQTKQRTEVDKALNDDYDDESDENVKEENDTIEGEKDGKLIEGEDKKDGCKNDVKEESGNAIEHNN